MYRIYTVLLRLNETTFTELWIDPHYELNHKASMNDALILELVNIVNFEDLSPGRKSINGFWYYELNLALNNKLYRLILTTPPDKSYLGVVNAYRRSK